MSKIKGMKNLEKKMSAVLALMDHINDFGGVESMYEGAARAQVEIMSAISGLASDFSIIVRMVQDYIMLLDELKKMKKEVQDGNEASAQITTDQNKGEWSEADKFYIEAVTDVIKNGGSIRPELRNEVVAWLESLKERAGGK